MNICLSCKGELEKERNKYCSNQCQRDYQHDAYIKRWKLGQVTGDRGKITKNISQHIRRYLIANYHEQCYICGWNKRHPKTKLVPLEIDHIDGNSSNNNEKNLRLICPNCHSLTTNFRNLNKGNGRIWRTLKYIKNKV